MPLWVSDCKSATAFFLSSLCHCVSLVLTGQKQKSLHILPGIEEKESLKKKWNFSTSVISNRIFPINVSSCDAQGLINSFVFPFFFFFYFLRCTHVDFILRTVAPVSSSRAAARLALGSDSPVAPSFITASRRSQHHFTPSPPPSISKVGPAHAAVSPQSARGELVETRVCRAMWQPRKEVSLSPHPCASILTMSGAACDSSGCVSEPALCWNLWCVCVCVSARVCAREGGVRKTIVSYHWLNAAACNSARGVVSQSEKSSDARFMNETACMRRTHSESEKTQWCNTTA